MASKKSNKHELFLACKDSFKIIKYNSKYFDSVVNLFFDSYKRKKSKEFFKCETQKVVDTVHELLTNGIKDERYHYLKYEQQKLIQEHKLNQRQIKAEIDEIFNSDVRGLS